MKSIENEIKNKMDTNIENKFSKFDIKNYYETQKNQKM